MPRVLPASSLPRKGWRVHCPARSEALAWGMLRVTAKSSARVCSAVVIVFPVGMLITSTPRRVAAATSIVSTPTPARATTCRVGVAASTASVTRVSLRTTIAW